MRHRVLETKSLRITIFATKEHFEQPASPTNARSYWRCFPACMDKTVACNALKALGNDQAKLIGDESCMLWHAMFGLMGHPCINTRQD